MADHECEECGARYGSETARDMCAFRDAEADRAERARQRNRCHSLTAGG